MTNEQRTALATYLRVIADLLELRDWRFSVSLDPPENPNHIASVQRTYGRRHAGFWFSANFFARSPEDQRQTVCHELLHCHLNECLSVLQLVHANLGEPVFDVVEGAMTDAIEYAIEAIAQAIAPHLPPPPTFELA